MNCKPGDLAVIVRANNKENIGRFVSIISVRAATTSLFGKLAWNVDGPGPGEWSFDDDLRPIGDNDGENETLTWAGKPQQIKETQ